MKQKLIKTGIKNLNEFGYPNVNEQNILTDVIYSGFFLSMLKDNLGHGEVYDKVINELINEIKQNENNQN